MNRFVSALLLVSALLCSELASSHHSQAAIDQAKTIELKGVVKKWEFMNPHSWIYVTVKEADGSLSEWEIGSASPSMLRSLGFTRTMLKEGDQVTLTIHPHRVKPRSGNLVTLTLPDGKTLRTPSREQEEKGKY